MGLIKNLGRKLGERIEEFGKQKGWTLIEKAGKALKDICGETARRTGMTGAYDPNVSSDSQTANLGDILSGFSLGLKAQAGAIENQSRLYVERYFEDIIKALEEDVGECAAIRNLKGQKSLIVQGIDGQLTNVLSRRVSLSDSECLEILRMPAGIAKEKKMEAFGKKVINEGIDNLCTSLKRSLDSVCETVTDEMNGMQAERERELCNLIKHMQELTEKRLKDAGNKEEAVLQYMQKLAVCDMTLGLIEGREML